MEVDIDRMITEPEAFKLAAWSASQGRRMAKTEADWPKARQISPWRRGYLLSEVLKYIRTRPVAQPDPKHGAKARAKLAERRAGEREVASG